MPGSKVAGILLLHKVCLAHCETVGERSLRGGSTNAAHVFHIGFPQGVNVWLDLEGIKPSISHGVVIDYCNAWIAEVASAGFAPGVYVGAKAILTGEEIFWRLQTKHFWRSGSKVPDIPHRGYQLIQKIIRGDNVGGIEIDRNLTVNDNFGQSVLWLFQNAAIVITV